MSWMLRSALLCVMTGGWSASIAHAQSPEVCRTILTERNVAVARQGPDPCFTLAVMVSQTSRRVEEAAAAILREDAIPVGAIFSQRDLQAKHPQQAALGGTPAQGQAIPGVQPAGVAAGTIAAVGTDAGQDAIAALGLNPAILFIGEEVSRRLAQYSRFADLTIFLPISDIDDPDIVDGDDELRYFGARLRINVHGLAAGDQVWRTARSLIQNWITRAGRNVQRVRQVLTQAPDPRACVNALVADESAAAITANCGTLVTFEVDLAEAEQLRNELSSVRQAADSKYFGADIRLDIGDPTLGAVANGDGNFLFAGLSYGRRLRGSTAQGPGYGFRARLGARHAKLDAEDDSEFAAEGGLGFELARLIDTQEINASAAVEFRYGNAPSNLIDQFQTNFVMLRGSFLLPFTTANGISINFGLPLTGDVSPNLSVNFNWGLLLSDQRAR